MTSSGEDMIERVTKTLSGELLRRGFMTQIEDGVRLKPDIEAMARAAIEAMMEPTEAMLLACWENHHPWGERAPPPSERPEMVASMCNSVTADWKAMLRTSLTGDTK